MTRGQIAYRGFSQLMAWLATVVLWLAPPAYAIRAWFIDRIGALEGIYIGIGCFVVLRELRNWAQGEADGNQPSIEPAKSTSASEAQK